MRTKHSAALLLSTTVLWADAACAQNYPSKPVNFISSASGSLLDITARLIAQGIAGPLGQPVVVENRPSPIVAESLAKAAPDGYTVGFAGPAVWITPLLQKTSYDPVRDFAPVTLTTTTPNIIAVHPSMPVRTVKDLIALAKAHPGELNYASGPTGGSGHLAGALFASMAGINVVRVPYKGSGMVVTAVITAEVPWAVFDLSVMPQVKVGKLRVIAVTSLEPSPLVPGVPTASASGLPGYETTLILGMLAPAGTPPAIIARLNQEIVRFLSRADMKEKLLDAGLVAAGSSPEQFGAIIKADMAKWGRVIKDAGIKLD